MSSPDLSIAILGGRSGPALHATLLSVDRAVARLRAERAMPFEILLLREQDAPDPGALVSGLDRREALRILPAGRDLSEARRAGVAGTRGRYLAFLEAGDMWSGNFLVEAVRAARREGQRHSVWRPEAVIGCGRDYFAFDLHATFQTPMPDAEAGAILLHECPYAPSFFAHRTVFDSVPFPAVDPRRGWEDVDPWWIAECLGMGYAQRILEGTALYGWNGAQSMPRTVRIGPTSLFASAADAGRWRA